MCPALKGLERLKAKLKAAQRKQREQQRRDEKCGLTDWQVKLVVAVYVLSQYDMDIAQRVGSELSGHAYGGRKRKTISPEDIPVRDWFLGLDPSAFDGMFLPATPAETYLRQQASRRISEIRAIRWVRDENFNRGTAPGSADVVDQYANLMESLDERADADSLVASASAVSRSGQRVMRRWAARVRKRWHISHRPMPSLDAPPATTLGAKARLE